MMKTQTHELRQKLQKIRSHTQNKSIQIALLTTFKEELTIKLEAKQKKRGLKQAAMSLQRENSISKTGQFERQSSFKGNCFLENQEKTLKNLMLVLIKLYDERTSINILQFELQKQFHTLQKDNISVFESQKTNLQLKHGIITSLKHLLMKLKNLSTQIKLFFEIFKDVLKVLRVKYILCKSKKKVAKKKKWLNSYTSPLSFRNDENRNQILVNL